jgi:hypothetical protein
MQTSEAQNERQERISLGGLMLTILVSNVAAFVYLAPYA